jgi:hypothetical protein
MIVRKKKKYTHGGVHPTREEKRQQMLSTGRFTEGPNGELIRVPQQDMFGFPTTERAQQLSESTDPLTEQQLREYISYGFSPTNPVNTAFSVIAGASPAGQAVDVLGNVVGKGLGYVSRGGRQLMNFLRPKADEAVEAAVSGFGSVRPKTSGAQVREATGEQLQEGLDVSNQVMAERLSEVMSPEGQRRARQQIVDQLTEFGKYTDDELQQLGLNKAEVVTLRNRLGRFDVDDAGNIIANQPRVDAALRSFNQNVQRAKNVSEGVARGARIQEGYIKKEQLLRSQYNEAMDAGDSGRASEINDELIALRNDAAVFVDEVFHGKKDLFGRTIREPQLRGAFYQPKRFGSSPEIQLNREYLLNPNEARVVTAHEFQHLLQDIPDLQVPQYAQAFGKTVETDRMLGKLKLIDKNSPNITTDSTDPLWQDLEYYRTGTGGQEKTPFLAEMREDMLSKGYITDRLQKVDDNLMERYLQDYYSGKDLYNPTLDYGKENVRILEIMDPFKRENATVLKDAMNKMLVAVPAVGAAGVAAGTTADDGASYYNGGKLKLRKAKSYGMGVRKK